jgi:hypothetical protein
MLVLVELVVRVTVVMVALVDREVEVAAVVPVVTVRTHLRVVVDMVVLL